MDSRSSRKFQIRPAPFDDYAWLSQHVRIMARVVRLLINEIRSPARIPLGRALRGWRLGFGRLSNVVYGIDKNDPRLYVSQVQQAIFCPRINGHYDHLLNNKLLFPRLMASIKLESPEIFAFTRKGVLRTNEGCFVQRPQDWLFETLEQQLQFVFKPVKGHKGRGLAFVELREGSLYVNGFSAEPSDVLSMIQGAPDSVVTEFVAQAEYARTLYSRTANTIRVLTLWDYFSGRPFVAAAAQRIGTERSFPTDNWLAGTGGLSCEVDLASGTLSKGVQVSPEWKLVWYERHPETNAGIEGRMVPGWVELKQNLTEAAGKLPWIPQIAWDILVTDTGFKVIEVNGSPGFPVHQVHRPLLADSRSRDFFRTHNVIR